MAVSPGPAVRQAWSPARIYLVASGVFLLVTSTAGFMINRTFPIGAEEFRSAESHHVFGVLETNGWHNLLGVIGALLALGFAIRPQWSRFGALFKGWIYVGVTAAVAIWSGDTFWVASNDADQVVHATLAVGGLITGFLTPRSRPKL
ncbi:MAG TPA: DUF4383 domain-containing protein [Actinomycetota bacterium]|nr:DUF4383 domain-containing protein [Actinomycetota bacterium]